MTRSTRSITAGTYHGTGRAPSSHDCHDRHAVGEGLPAASITSRWVSPSWVRQCRRSAGRIEFRLGSVDPVAEFLHPVHVSICPVPLAVDPMDFFFGFVDQLSQGFALRFHASSRLARGRSRPPRSPHYIEYISTHCVRQGEKKNP